MRISHIDGIRGWAALCVLAFHLVWEIFGVVIPSLRSPSLRFLFDGPLAVYVFFILSGDALSLGFTQPGGNGVSPKMVLKRYFRLAGPIVFSCAVVYLLMRQGLVFNKEAGEIVSRVDWLGSFIDFNPSSLAMVKYALYDIFVKNSTEISYNPFLWPMQIELVGSFLVFFFGFIYKSLRYPVFFSVAIAAFFWRSGSFYALFFVGVIFGNLRARLHFERVQKFKWNRLGVFAGFALIAVLDGVLEASGHRTQRLMIFLAIAVVYLCYASADIVFFMQNSVSRFIGRLSFPLYFMQFAVIVSYTSWLITTFYSQFGGGLAFVAFTLITSTLLTFAVAYVVEAIEIKYLSYVDSAVRWLLRP